MSEWARFFGGLAEREPNEVCASGRHSSCNAGVIRDIQKDIANKLHLGSSDVLLDIGCGTGLIGRYLSIIVGNTVGVDFGQEVLFRARRTLQANNNDMSLIQADMTALPFRDATFDKVLCYSTVHYLPDYEQFKQALLEMTRVAKSGALILVGDIPEKNRKELWVKGGRKKGESAIRYLVRRLGDKAVLLKYNINAFLDMRRSSKLGIDHTETPPGMSYDAETIMHILGEMGIKGDILDQLGSLPFSHTRVDLILEKVPENNNQ